MADVKEINGYKIKDYYSTKNKFPNSYDLKTHQDTMYTVPEDGYLYVQTTTALSGYVYIYDANGNSLGALGGSGDAAYMLRLTKGMKCVIYNYSIPYVGTFYY